jgi:ATP-dependent protease HslVU (ClpYQ) peptidase subunit
MFECLYIKKIYSMDTATCIVGLVHENKVWMGADSAATNKFSSSQTIRKDSKIFIREDSAEVKWLFGFTTSYRMGQLIQYVLELPPFDENAAKDPHAFMVKKFIPALQKCFAENGFQQKKDDQVSGGTFLVGLKGNLFGIADNYQVSMLALSYDAVGCGENFALGAMFATEGQDPKQRIETALKAAEEFSSGVRGPFIILST